MGASDAIKEALHYPLIDYKKWLMFALVFLVLGILTTIGEYYPSIASIMGIIVCIISIFLLGFGVSVIAKTIEGSEEIPEFDIAKNFVDGIKAVILYIIYYIIPLIITLIVAAVSGVFTNGYEALTYIANSSVANQTVTSSSANTGAAMINNFTSAVPASVQAGLINGIIITAIVAIIVFLLFTLLLNIGLARMAETGSLSKGLGLGTVFKKVGFIGWGTYIVWYILVIIVSIIIGIIGSLIGAIPYIGMIISMFIISSFAFLFNYRAIGNIYKEE